MIPSKQEWTDALILRHCEELQKKFEQATVAVCGLGGLGSNISIFLARAGIGKLILIDFDEVDVTNLQRQQYKATQVGQYKTEAISENLREIAPYLEIEAINAKISEDNFESLLKDADIICEAFDNPEAKAMLTGAVLENMPEKFYVAGSGLAGMGKTNKIRTRRVSERFYLSGDGVSGSGPSVPLIAPRVGICAAHQAHTILRIIAGKYDV